MQRALRKKIPAMATRARRHVFPPRATTPRHSVHSTYVQPAHDGAADQLSFVKEFRARNTLMPLHISVSVRAPCILEVPSGLRNYIHSAGATSNTLYSDKTGVV